jgi:transcriptional regulator with XRE-family HTH domain
VTGRTQESRPFHPDVRKRRSAAVLAMAAALEHRPTPTAPDQREFLVCLADLARICLPSGAPDTDPSDDDLRLLAFTGMMSRSETHGYRETEEIFDGDLLIDGAYYQTPDSRRGPYAGAPDDPETNPRRLVARMVLRIVQEVVSEERHLAAARALLTWTVDVPPVARELTTRRARAGKDRARIAAVAGVSSVSTVSNWESGRTIPHRHDWPGLCDAYGFTQEEFVRFLDRTGPPERRGTPSHEPADSETDIDIEQVVVPQDDCDVQKRRVAHEAPRLGAVPVWQHDVAGLRGIGGWFLDIPDREDDDADTPSPQRRRSGPSQIPHSAPETGNVLGPVSLSALMHSPYWAMCLIETSGPLAEHATRQVMARRQGAAEIDDYAVGAALETAGELGMAYQHARLLHSLHKDPPGSDLEAAAERAVADALSKVAVLTLIYSR